MNTLLDYPLVTGAGGFIGRNLVQYLLENTNAKVITAVDLPNNGHLRQFRDNPRVNVVEADLNFNISNVKFGKIGRAHV